MAFLPNGSTRNRLIIYVLYACVLLSYPVAVSSDWSSYYVDCCDDLDDCQKLKSGAGAQKQKDDAKITALEAQILADAKTIDTLKKQILAVTINWPFTAKTTARTQDYTDGPYTVKLSLACENLDAKLDCTTASGTVIQIISAAYGFPDDPGCGTVKSSYCQADVLAKIQDPKNSFSCPDTATTCTVTASNGNFGDPCPSTGKSLEIFYQCVKP